ncbi:MAG: hypothetical protein JWO25_2932, partial [Alphaproteobacteria bacterium]|nr:hypothetical protein [Alphaproteobacteria bacterium]
MADNGLYILEDFPRGNPKCRRAERRQNKIPLRITLRAIPTIMGFAVHLDGEPRFVAVEIEDVASCRLLP